ncbi:MAG: aminoglycoside phosphotransferase family protein [Chloroflexi bacterium]|nr:aminoglycoside phosphotransferase family protein [Chloroflexota bacterium]
MQRDTQNSQALLSQTTLQWIVEVVGSSATIQSIRRLAGVTSSMLCGVEVLHNGQNIKLVLRQFTNADWLAEEPDLARHEAASLEKAREADVPVPALIAWDETGEHCGVPAILMTQLAGRVELTPPDFDRWLYQLAEAIVPIHAVELGTFPWRYAPYNDVSRLEPPAWSRHPELWEKAIEIVNGPWPEVRECFIHRDYHPNNVLWQDDRVSGIVDWPNACRGPAGMDVAWCRGNLVGLYGVAAADQFLDAYQSLAGSSFAYHPHWDVLQIIEELPGPPDVFPPWIDFGMQNLTDEIVRERVDEYLVSLMTRF